MALILGSLIAVFLLTDLDIRKIGAIPTGLPDFQMPVFSTEHWLIMFAPSPSRILTAVVMPLRPSIH